MNFSDELRQLSTEKQQEMEKRAKPHALEKELVTWIVAMIQQECRKQAGQGKTTWKDTSKKTEIIPTILTTILLKPVFIHSSMGVLW